LATAPELGGFLQGAQRGGGPSKAMMTGPDLCPDWRRDACFIGGRLHQPRTVDRNVSEGDSPNFSR
jgi:hypothetical protein